VFRARGLGEGFRAVWVATAFTALGARVTAVALPLLAVLTLHASAGEVGLLATAQWLPFLLISLPLGVLFDRQRRRPLLVAAEVGRALVLLALIVLLLAGVLDVVLLVALAVMLGCCTVLFEVGYQSYLPSVVPKDLLEVANSRLQSTESVALIAGPGVGGLLVQALTAAGALAVQVVTSLVSALTLATVRRPEPPVTGPRVPLLPAVAEGVRFLMLDPVLRWAVGFSAISNLFVQWIEVLFTVDAVRRLGLTAGQFGLVFSIGAGGALLGAAAAPRVSRGLGDLPACMWCAAVEPPVLLALPALPADLGVPALVALAGAVFAVTGATGALSSVIVLTARQVRVPDTLRGRVNATTRMIAYGSITLGAAGAGLAGQLLGARTGLAIGCVGAFTTIIWTVGVGRTLLRRGIRIEASEPAS
jgi:MFS family permease